MTSERDVAAVSRETDERVAACFGAAAGIARRYAEILTTVGVERGLLGPRETSRVWDRHLLNCAVLAPALPSGGTVVDVGSGAGLPGVVLAIARPDVQMLLVEPLQRRVDFLREVVDMLELARVDIRRARAEELHGAVAADVVTARAVAPLVKLVPLAMPLVRPGGSLLALKGARAAEEMAAAEKSLQRHGAAHWVVELWGGTMLAEPTTVVRVTAGDGASAAAGTARSARRSRTQRTHRASVPTKVREDDAQ